MQQCPGTFQSKPFKTLCHITYCMEEYEMNDFAWSKVEMLGIRRLVNRTDSSVIHVKLEFNLNELYRTCQQFIDDLQAAHNQTYGCGNRGYDINVYLKTAHQLKTMIKAKRYISRMLGRNVLLDDNLKADLKKIIDDIESAVYPDVEI